MTRIQALSSASFEGNWRDDPVHRSWLAFDARRQLDFFRSSLREDGGFDVLDWSGAPRSGIAQELHVTTRLVHAYAMGAAFGDDRSAEFVDAGMSCLWDIHRDATHGGYYWSVNGKKPTDTTKLAYGHVFVLLAAASAKQAGHADADRLLSDATSVLDEHFWDEGRGLFREEYHRDWSSFSSYRGMNANMHGVEALLAAFEATGNDQYLQRAGRILDFFVHRIAATHAWRISEHYDAEWQIDLEYAGDPMFRPKGTTPGHSLELGRLMIQHWDLSGRKDDEVLGKARSLIERALADAWRPEGGLCYTLDYSGEVLAKDRYWWPVAEAIAAISALQQCDPRAEDEVWYRRIWQFAYDTFVDHRHGGWYPEIDESGQPVQGQFTGKPDIYHSLQAVLIPLAGSLSASMASLKGLKGI